MSKNRIDSENFEEMIKLCIDSLLPEQDKTENLSLTKTTTRSFVKQKLTQKSQKVREISDKDLKSVFDKFDNDRDYVLKKDEMEIVIKKISELL